ncbi:cytochrome B561, N terminal-domain-containing protein [Phlyctochytrium arcticum]|nr:cytochrome B561, N terminal-domain-containing protein [Phlyctochytrium arcticum]
MFRGSTGPQQPQYQYQQQQQDGYFSYPYSRNDEIPTGSPHGSPTRSQFMQISPSFDDRWKQSQSSFPPLFQPSTPSPSNSGRNQSMDEQSYNPIRSLWERPEGAHQRRTPQKEEVPAPFGRSMSSPSNRFGFASSPPPRQSPRSQQPLQQQPQSSSPNDISSPDRQIKPKLDDSALRWEHPAIREVKEQLEQLQFTTLDYQKATWNSVVLFVIFCIWVMGGIRYLRGTGPFPSGFVVFLLLALATVPFINLLCLAVKYFRVPPDFAEYDLTPAQRRMLGLNPNVEYKPDKTPKFSKIIKPRIGETKKAATQKSPSGRETPHGGATTPLTSPSKKTPIRPGVASPVSPLARFKGSTSPTLKSESVRNRRSLDKMLSSDRQTEENRDNYPRMTSSPMESPYEMNTHLPAIPKYQNASLPSTPAKVQERIEDGVVVKDAQKTLDEWNVGSYIDDWTENTRTWLATHVLKVLARRIQDCDQKFNDEGLDHLSCSAATMHAGMVAANNAAMAAITASTTQQPTMYGLASLYGTAPDTNSNKPQTLYDLSQRYKDHPLVQERLKLENYLTLPDYNCRSYIVQRILCKFKLSHAGFKVFTCFAAFANGNNLASYQWNSGSSWQGKPWSNEWYPTDAQLVMHMFCRFLDEMMPGENFATYGNLPFSPKYFVPLGVKPGPSQSIQIRHYTRWPPHYNLVVEGTVYDVYPGRNNVFQVIALFTHYINKEASGYIGPLNVAGKTVELTSIVRGGPASGRLTDFRSSLHTPTGRRSPEQASSDIQSLFGTARRLRFDRSVDDHSEVPSVSMSRFM